MITIAHPEQSSGELKMLAEWKTEPTLIKLQFDLGLHCLLQYPISQPRWLSWMRRPGGRGFNPRRGRQHSFVEIDHEIFSTVILSLPLIQEGQLSVSGERMCTILANRLED